MVYVGSDTQRRIDAAKQTLVTACMASHGLTYTPYVEHGSDDEALAELRPFGLESLDGAPAEQPPPEPIRSDAYAHALFGDPAQRVIAKGARLEISRPATGCVADAEYRLLGDARLRVTELRLRIFDGERDAREQLDQDPIFVAANSRWRGCMNLKGIDAPNPSELLGALPDDVDLTTHPATQADVHCKDETGYLTVAYARLTAAQKNWLDTHPEIVAEWFDLHQRQDTVARAVLTS